MDENGSNESKSALADVNDKSEILAKWPQQTIKEFLKIKRGKKSNNIKQTGGESYSLPSFYFIFCYFVCLFLLYFGISTPTPLLRFSIVIVMDVGVQCTVALKSINRV